MKVGLYHNEVGEQYHEVGPYQNDVGQQLLASNTISAVTNGNWRYIYLVWARHFSSAGLEVSNVGGVKCQLILKRGNYWQRILKMFKNGIVRFGYRLALN